MKQVRRSVFETNSSSTHSITICTEDEYEKFKSGELMYDSWGESWFRNPLSSLRVKTVSIAPTKISAITDGNHLMFILIALLRRVVIRWLPLAPTEETVKGVVYEYLGSISKWKL